MCLPLAITFADCGLRTVIYDIKVEAVAQVRRGEVPFAEEGAAEMLRHVLDRETLEARHTPELLAECEFLVLIVGTPVDEHLNPTFTAIHRALDLCLDYLRDGHIF